MSSILHLGTSMSHDLQTKIRKICTLMVIWLIRPAISKWKLVTCHVASRSISTQLFEIKKKCHLVLLISVFNFEAISSWNQLSWTINPNSSLLLCKPLCVDNFRKCNFAVIEIVNYLSRMRTFSRKNNFIFKTRILLDLSMRRRKAILHFN